MSAGTRAGMLCVGAAFVITAIVYGLAWWLG